MTQPLNKEDFLMQLPDEHISVKGDWETREFWVNDKKLSLEKSLRVLKGSITGFNWGFAGTGPGQLALAILLEFVDPETALLYHQLLKFKYVRTLPQSSFQGTVHLRGYMKSAFEDEQGLSRRTDDLPILVTQDIYDILVASNARDIERFAVRGAYIEGEPVATGQKISQVNDISDSAKKYFIDQAWNKIEKEFIREFAGHEMGPDDWVQSKISVKAFLDFFKERTRPA